MGYLDECCEIIENKRIFPFNNFKYGKNTITVSLEHNLRTCNITLKCGIYKNGYKISDIITIELKKNKLKNIYLKKIRNNFNFNCKYKCKLFIKYFKLTKIKLFNRVKYFNRFKIFNRFKTVDRVDRVDRVETVDRDLKLDFPIVKNLKKSFKNLYFFIDLYIENYFITNNYHIIQFDNYTDIILLSESSNTIDKYENIENIKLKTSVSSDINISNNMENHCCCYDRICYNHVKNICNSIRKLMNLELDNFGKSGIFNYLQTLYYINNINCISSCLISLITFTIFNQQSVSTEKLTTVRSVSTEKLTTVKNVSRVENVSTEKLTTVKSVSTVRLLSILNHKYKIRFKYISKFHLVKFNKQQVLHYQLLLSNNPKCTSTVLCHTDTGTKGISSTDTKVSTNSTTKVNTNTNNSTKDTTGTTGPSTVTQGKGANSTAIECTSGKGANSTAMECTPGKGANSMPMECTPGKGANSMPMECTMGKGANSTLMECTSEKILNEIAAVTNSGESSTFSEGVNTGVTSGVNTEETPFGAGTKDTIESSLCDIGIEIMYRGEILSIERKNMFFIKIPRDFKILQLLYNSSLLTVGINQNNINLEKINILNEYYNFQQINSLVYKYYNQLSKSINSICLILRFTNYNDKNQYNKLIIYLSNCIETNGKLCLNVLLELLSPDFVRLTNEIKILILKFLVKILTIKILKIFFRQFVIYLLYDIDNILFNRIVELINGNKQLSIKFYYTISSKLTIDKYKYYFIKYIKLVDEEISKLINLNNKFLILFTKIVKLINNTKRRCNYRNYYLKLLLSNVSDDNCIIKDNKIFFKQFIPLITDTNFYITSIDLNHTFIYKSCNYPLIIYTNVIPVTVLGHTDRSTVGPDTNVSSTNSTKDLGAVGASTVTGSGTTNSTKVSTDTKVNSTNTLTTINNNTTKDTIGASTVTKGKGANFTATKCTTEKILNEIAVVTNSGESSTFSKDTKDITSKDIKGSEGTGTEGPNTEVNTKEAPFGAGTKETGAVGPHTVTEEKIKIMLKCNNINNDELYVELLKTIKLILNKYKINNDFIIIYNLISIFNNLGYIQLLNTTITNLNFNENVDKNFENSFIIMSIMNYLFEIGDRNYENIIITNGYLVNVDCNYMFKRNKLLTFLIKHFNISKHNIFNKSKKESTVVKDSSLKELSTVVKESVTEPKSVLDTKNEFKKEFRNKFKLIFKLLRKHYKLIINLLYVSNIDIINVLMVEERFLISYTGDQLDEKIDEIIQFSYNSHEYTLLFNYWYKFTNLFK
ncbi:Phosphoinositide 3-kinase-like protein, putative [Theileria annulata]|uniref:Phosphoinositide 3-kinase-like protein, putative n=1 Tax=Theileria annulata TaxID=5874 RepID=Q4UH85_THEAN|nr:Phosphoinositide 3-kinase-like protein, putative [Theileria annulata]CAI73554.1 Phosphoinositide 3-kinase-like protein, putative [Theileria annulata]|eukprot:XP_954231.1 Phosphoinositide 3-kinase-like protein, putative [Theileria annulata]